MPRVLRSRSRSGRAADSQSRSPSRECAPRGRANYKAWSGEFDKWAADNLGEDVTGDSNKMWSLFKQGGRRTKKYLKQLEGGRRSLEVDEFKVDTIESWGLRLAKQAFRAKQQPGLVTPQPSIGVAPQPGPVTPQASIGVTPQPGIDVKSEPGTGEKQQRPHTPIMQADVGPSEHEMEGDENALAVTCSNPLEVALKTVRDVQARAEKDAEVCAGKLDKLDQKKKNLKKSIATLSKQIQVLTGTARKIPAVKLQLDTLKNQLEAENRQSAQVEHSITHAKDALKAAETKVKDYEKEEKALKNEVDMSMTTLVSEPDLDRINAWDNKLRELFDLMTRKDECHVSSLDFIAALAEHDDISNFFKLPSSIKQEDGSRDKFEEIFQRIADNRKSFTLDELVAAYALHD